MRRFLALTLAAALSVVATERVSTAELPYYRHNGERTGPRTVLYYPRRAITARASESLAIPPEYSLAKGPGTFSAPAGLPPGLTLNPATGLLTAYATSSTSLPSVTVELTDAAGFTVGAATPPIVVLPQLRLAYPGTLTGVVGAGFDASPLVYGGVGGAPSVKILSGSLPAGIELDPVSGHLGGSPRQAGTTRVTFALLDASDGRQVSAGETAFVITEPGPLSVSAAPPDAMVNKAYAYAVPVTGGRAPMTFTVLSGTVPPNLALTAAGVLQGTATEEGAGSLAFRVRDFDGREADGTLAVRVVRSLAVTAPSLPRGTVGIPYPAGDYAVSNAVGAVSWSQVGLPDGMALTPAGRLQGTPTAAASTSFTATATDSRSNGASLTSTLAIDAPLAAAAPALPLGATGTAYPTQTFTTTGGNGTKTWTATGLPDGLAMTTAGRIQGGTPKVAGSFVVHATVRDASGRTASVDASIQVSDVFAIAAAQMPAGTVGTAATLTLSTAGGQAPVRWTVDSGAPADGVTLSSEGVVAGRPTVAGTFAFVARATDALGATATISLSNTVAAPVAVDGPPDPLPRGTQGVAYAMGATPFSASGGRTAPTLQLSGQHSGLSLSNGAIVGTPGSAGTRTVTVTAADADGRSSSTTRTLPIDAPLAVSGTLMPADVVGTAMAPYGLQASGGRAPYAWTIDRAALHLGVDATDAGVLTGTPTSTGTRSFAVSVRDVDGRTAAGRVSHTVDADQTHPSLVGAPPSSVPLSTSLSSSPFSATGGVGPYAYTVSAGWLPPGVSLSSAGTLAGSPTYSGTWSFSVRVTDANGRTGEGGPFAMQVTGPYTISGSLPQRGRVGQAYSSRFYVTAAPTSGKFFAYVRTGLSSWGGASQAVIPGVTINQATGVVSGTPTTPGTYANVEIWHDVGSWLGVGPFTVTIDP